ncbi:GH23037 [Drosophila grimshawi]|uniref:GH23037 n=1 Tax=Drosophila grimshawi TaxID=7222 RepID=B4JWG6_DROGR|nr:GH23037 [Drosophila grimshawi]
MSSTTLIEGRSPMLNEICKLWLLIRKNLSVLLSQPLAVSIIILSPILLFLYTQIEQFISDVESTEIAETIYPHIELHHPFITSIMYSPANEVLKGVIEEVATILGANHTEAFLYATDLEVALLNKDGFVGIEFEDKLRSIIELPSEVNVALRFPLHLRSQVKRIWPHRLYDAINEQKARSIYDTEGFLIVQARLSEVLMRTKNESANIPQVLMQPFPDIRRTDNSHLLPMFNNCLTYFVFRFLGPCLIIGQQIVVEKQRNLREIMRLMGLTVGFNWLSWFIVAYIFYGIPMLVIACLMKWLLCPSTHFLVLFHIFFMYLITLICFTFMISAFVTSTVMAMATISLSHIASHLPYMLTGAEPTLSQSVINGLFLNSAIPSIWVQVRGFELRGDGAQWGKLFDYSHPDDNLSIGAILLLMMASNVFRLLICFYGDQLVPGHLAAGQKWYFPLKRKFWCPWDRPRQNVVGVDEEQPIANTYSRPTMPGFQEVLHNRPVIVEAQRLHKVYDDIEVVRDLSLKLYEDEITVLLGHNGSGKTTTFMMLAGMTRPTSGRVLVNGHDMATSTQKARESFSICPQNNVLFEELSAYWHIVFYSRLKGYQRADAEVEALKYLEIMNLMDKSSMSVKNLSTGMRRKLSICCALCANTKVVLCDEPTDCLDPIARREVWNLFRMEKTGRCIVLSTHIMEAAEVLGDRVAIICDGQLYGNGTPEFIVNQLGPGYRLVRSSTAYTFSVFTMCEFRSVRNWMIAMWQR